MVLLAPHDVLDVVYLHKKSSCPTVEAQTDLLKVFMRRGLPYRRSKAHVALQGAIHRGLYERALSAEQIIRRYSHYRARELPRL